MSKYIRPDTSDPTVLERFMARAMPEPTTGCWLWLGYITTWGYGEMSLSKNKRVHAHRAAFELFIGPIPSGMQIDHVKARGCSTRACVNPEHLEAVTQKENLRRGSGFAGRHFRATHCENGHEFTEANTYRPPRGGRQCRRCARLRRNDICPACLNSGAVDRNGRIVACSCGLPMVQPAGGARR